MKSPLALMAVALALGVVLTASIAWADDAPKADPVPAQQPLVVPQAYMLLPNNMVVTFSTADACDAELLRNQKTLKTATCIHVK